MAIATVVETWGSAPRPVGSHLVIDAEGNFEGSVSGGCVEGAVIAEALDVIAERRPNAGIRRRRRDSLARRLVLRRPHQGLCRAGWTAGLNRTLDPVGTAQEPRISQRLNAARQARAAMLLTDLDHGDDSAGSCMKGRPGGRRTGRSDRQGLSRSGKSGTITVEGRRSLLQRARAAAAAGRDRRRPHQPGAGADGAIAGFDVAIIDPRTAFNSEERFADVPRDTRWPDEALADLSVDPYTALAALTHDPKIDDFALKPRARGGLLLCRCARQPQDPRQARRAAAAPAVSTEIRLPASMRRSGWTSAPSPRRDRGGDPGADHRSAAQARRGLRQGGGGVKFGPVATWDALGAILAHSISAGDRRAARGPCFCPNDIDRARRKLASRGHRCAARPGRCPRGRRGSPGPRELAPGSGVERPAIHRTRQSACRGNRRVQRRAGGSRPVEPRRSGDHPCHACPVRCRRGWRHGGDGQDHSLRGRELRFAGARDIAATR